MFKLTGLSVAAFALILAAVAGYVYLRRAAALAYPPAAGMIPVNSVFHKPVQANCPAGTVLMPNYFIEEHAKPLDACYNPEGDGSIDYLNPGEGVNIRLFLQPSPVPDERSRS